MKKLLIISALALSFTAASAQAIKQDPQVEAQVEALLSKMTLADKVGQMCELTIDKVAQKSSDDHVISNKSMQSLAGGMLSAEKVNEAFTTYRVGSILNVPEGIAQTPKVWADVIRTLNSASEFQCGVPELYGVDEIHGASYVWGATLFPQEVSQGASFNKNIPYRIGQITAYESRASLIPWVYSPVMDVARSPLWSRMWESFGEDWHVNAIMASQLTRGLQGDDPNHLGMNNVAACLKHYMAYGAVISGKDRTPSSVTYREMMEKYFQPFRACIEAGALSLMVNSGNNSGMPFHANHKLLTEWAKEGLNWDGMIVTDWADIDNLWKRDHVAANKKDAICMAINAGIDMTMDPYSTDFCTLLTDLVNEGRVPMSRIDDAVRRILRLKVRIGLMDRSTWDIPYERVKGMKKKDKTLTEMYPDFGSDKFAQEATSMAEECMVLLKNKDNILPLKQGTKLFVCGPNADNFRPMNGGWSYTWQGNMTDSVCRAIGKYNTFYTALANKFGKDNVEFSEMVKYDMTPEMWRNDMQVPELLIEDGNRTIDKILRSDVIVACIGENSYCETVGNIDDLTLSQNQLDMVKSLAQYGKPIILVLNEGRPRIIADIEPMASAVVHTFLPSNYGGDALANLLAGDANFSGRLPYTYPKYHGSFITYDCKPAEFVETMEGAYNYEAHTVVQWPFGYGLSYSDVKYSNFKLTHQPATTGTAVATCGFSPATAAGPQYAEGDMLTFTVDVTNNSNRAVKEPVLLFVSDLVATLTPDVKRLRAFDKVDLAPGETKTVTFKVAPSDLSYVNEDMQWILEPGQFSATCGNESVTFELK
ncbi:MAG: glycoside hydrolase family 3 C-terminal domain-containing protein [Muribaculaceae bacterium]|nr:glycoside hydrolase family 3 C-terminal domain-containing protein [Muribaculaceae bacterium]